MTELSKTNSPRAFIAVVVGLSLSLSYAAAAIADGGVHYRDVSRQVGVHYRRAPSETIANRDFVNHFDVITFFDIALYPLKGDGAPGVSILDYDKDGDLDFFISNGPGRAHSLYENQLEERGEAVFRDVARQAGVAAVGQDGTGSCFGDIDNDGDHDLLVLGRAEQHRLFLNNGDGTFEDLREDSGIGAGVGAASCAMGDIDNDGLLDIAIAETYDWSTFLGIVAIPFDLNVHNQLYRNVDGARFEDVSVERGFTDLASGGMPADVATITWSMTMVDYDQDGDIDILHGDDQASVPGAIRGGADRGYTHLFENDGTGYFENKTLERGLDVTAHWMSFSWADYDCDRGLDFFNTSVGDYMYQALDDTFPLSYELGEWPSAWFFSNSAGGFDFPPVGTDLVATPWGWGSSSLDYDNDGDADIMYHGGLHMGFINALDNPGTIMQNKGVCSGGFRWDQNALTRSHTRRGVEGMAVGDLNRDGFPDVVSAAGFTVPQHHGLVLFDPYGSYFDTVAYRNELLRPINDLPLGPGKEFVWEGKVVEEGDAVVEFNSAGNRNRWVAVELQGSVGTVSGATVNRDGIGGIVTVTPYRGSRAKRPIEAGGSYASQNALEQTFGLGLARSATVDVQWPGGVRNRLHHVKSYERIRFPEIPCSIDASHMDLREYKRCVRTALHELRGSGAVSAGLSARLYQSAVTAWLQER